MVCTVTSRLKLLCHWFKINHFVSVPPATTFLSPQCSLPRNLTGTWLTQGVQYLSNIRINDTHIYFNTQKNQYEYQETYYSCQQSQGTRYLMTKVVVGKWYIVYLYSECIVL